jgi:hypothetical protein
MDLGGITSMGKPFEFAHRLKMLWPSLGSNNRAMR